MRIPGCVELQACKGADDRTRRSRTVPASARRGAARVAPIFLLLAAIGAEALAVDGSFDPTWAGGGSVVFSGDPETSSNNTGVLQIIVGNSGRLLVGGFDSNSIGLGTWYVGELQPGGTPVLTFGASNGSGMTSGCYLASALCSLSDAYFSGMALQSDGHIAVLSGQVLARLTATAGALDTSGVVGGTGYATVSNLQINDVKGAFLSANSPAQLASGQWLVAGLGTYSQADTNEDFAVIRLNADLSLDTSFDAQTDSKMVTFAGGQVVVFNPGGGAEAISNATQVLVQGDGRILLLGYVFVGKFATPAVARLNANGTLDTTYGGGTGQAILTWSDGTLTSPAAGAGMLDEKGRLVFATGAAPTATGIDGMAIVRVLDDGTLDPGFGSNGVSYQISPLCGNGAFAIALTSDSAGRIVAAGSCYPGDGSVQFLITRVHGDDGTLDTGFGFGGFSHGNFTATGTQDYLGSIVIDSSGHPVFGGTSYTGITSTAAVGRVTYDLIRTNGFEAAPTGRLPGQ